MNNLALAALWGLIIGAGGTAGGAALTLVMKTSGKRLPAALLGLAGGIMTATVLFDMVPHAAEHGEWYTVVISFAAGAAAILLVSRFIPHKDVSCGDLPADVSQDPDDGRLTGSGILLAAGIAIHNLPQGVALGSGISGGTAFLLGILLFAHNVPEGMAMGIPLKIAGVPGKKIALIGLLAAVPTCIGAVIGAAVGDISETFICICTAFAAGSMLYLTVTELIPRAVSFRQGAYPWAFFALGLLLGVAVICLTHTH